MSFNTITQTFDGVAAVHRQCWCGISFAIPASLNAHYLQANERERGSFSLHCPMGHAMIPSGESEADKLRDQLARERHCREQAEARRAELYAEVAQKTRQVNGYKGVVTRMKRRTVAGRCPCCSHTFKDVKRHVASKHPKWNPDVEANHRAADPSERRP